MKVNRSPVNLYFMEGIEEKLCFLYCIASMLAVSAVGKL